MFKRFNIMVAAGAIALAVTSSANGALLVEYKKGEDPEVKFSTDWTRKEFVKKVEKYLQNNTLDDLAARFAGLVEPSKNYNPFSSKTWLDAKFGSDLRLVFKDQKNVFILKRDGKRLYRFNGPDDIAVPGPEAGAGFASLLMATIGAYVVRRCRRKELVA